MATLLLIDGSSYLFRAFHALPPLSNRDGEPTGAMFGVLNMLRRHLAERPDYVAVVFDASGPTFREQLDPQYKANRPPMPDELRAQVEPLLALVKALGLPLLRVEGVEADDVIGTLARQGAQAGMDVVISTSDKDFAQLVDGRITLVNTMSGTRLDREGVMEKFGVPPERIIDFLALVGDSVDNVPGVDKCGPKTAAKWLAEHGSLDAIMAAADRFTGKLGQNLRAALLRLPLNRQLVTIRTDVPLDVRPQDLRPGEPDRGTLRRMYSHYGFTSALRELDAGQVAPPAAGNGTDASPAAPVPGTGDPVPRQYELVLDEAAWAHWLQRLREADSFAFDTETTGLDPQQARLVGLSLAVAPGQACYVPLAHDGPGVPAQLPKETVLAGLAPLLADPGKTRIAQNGKYDLHILRRAGVEVADVTFDTMLESYVLNATATRHDMDSLAARYLGVTTITYDEVTGKGSKRIGFSQVDLETATAYAAEDADITLRLHQALWPRLQAEPDLRRVFEEIEMPLLPVLARMEATGVLIDRDMLAEQGRLLRRRMQELERRAHELAGRAFSLDSPRQLQQVLFNELGLPVTQRTGTGQPSTNEEALEALAHEHPLPRVILDYRGLAKLVSTYTDRLVEQINPETGRVHTSYQQAVAATGRLSSTDPNLQNIPVRTEEGRRIRQAFIAPPGRKILAADYSQIELRIMAHISGDASLRAAFHDNTDVHRFTAAEVFGVPQAQVTPDQRRSAKAINFGLIYGMSAFGLGKQLGIPTSVAQRYIDLYFARYPDVKGYMERTRDMAREKGYVETLFGRRLYIPEINSRNAQRRQYAERTAINAPMQGTAADIIKRAMIAVDAWIQESRAPVCMIMQVHDELVFEVAEDYVDEAAREIGNRMCRAAQLAVPLVVDVGIGSNWDEAH